MFPSQKPSNPVRKQMGYTMFSCYPSFERSERVLASKATFELANVLVCVGSLLGLGKRGCNEEG